MKGIRVGDRERESDRHEDIQKVERTKKNNGVGACECMVCQPCDV